MDGSLDPRVRDFLRRRDLASQAAIRDFYRDRPYLDPNAVLEGRDAHEGFTDQDRVDYRSMLTELDRRHTREGEELDATLKSEAAASARRAS
ncbi:MAG TPA: hypothetical protein PK331_11255 [Gordonia sp. (in: high G+C Gram-positive bacteria)]|uniref:hypothetical protein n=1 Tax=unclassified Gordonia (in: high G+C Gram-positive bacteria) TaxID=2657482 RepID=UPI000FBF871C|nr:MULTISPECIES: hypothetical protein [unclassified Gordonia (in: high G+C Gram-positive bacteria)]RUP36656.1 MAG: hypothetical protein EKK60_14455 [Gordonia sp. (in: high G+C Gram-positive bacteria)]HNP57927.1 hypothetical protein [Gordonia sp. (in: high G+C Gram-positive bacteria)]HRC51479.1 hypothetical protein [Gordonia sp. (in: high G+C Gram-positive bacteria)]